MLQSIAEYCRVLQSIADIAEYYRVLQSIQSITKTKTNLAILNSRPKIPLIALPKNCGRDFTRSNNIDYSLHLQIALNANDERANANSSRH